jgi:hypothetical protein
MRRRATRRRLAVALLTGVLVAGCTGSGDEADDGDGEGEGADTVPEDAWAEGPAPSAVSTEQVHATLRVDEVTRDGTDLDLRLTVVVSDETRWHDDDLRLISDSGIELPRAQPQERVLPAFSEATVELALRDVPDVGSRVTLSALRMELPVPLPEDGQSLRWRPAPLRQVGFQDGLMRDASSVSLVPYTFRTEGMISEFTFLAMTDTHVNPTLCAGATGNRCELSDDRGTTYLYLGGEYEFPEFGHVRGTMRFAGEVPSEVRELRWRVAGYSGFMTDPAPALELPFDLPAAGDSPLQVAAGATLPAPFEVGEAITDGEGLRVDLGRMSFFEDRIQLEVTATTDEDEERLNNGVSLLRDPSGYEHALTRAGEDRVLTVTAGETIQAVLAFNGRLAPGTMSLDLVLETRGEGLTTTIAIPDS